MKFDTKIQDYFGRFAVMLKPIKILRRLCERSEAIQSSTVRLSFVPPLPGRSLLAKAGGLPRRFAPRTIDVTSKIRKTLFPAFAALLLAPAAAMALPMYTITDLGTLPGRDTTRVTGMSDNGLVVGDSITGIGNSDYHGFLWKKGDMTDLGDLPGGDNFTQAVSVNKHGQVAGFSRATTGDRAFLWDKVNGMTNLDDPPVGFVSAAYGINNSGQVVGLGVNANGLLNAVLWNNGGRTDLGTLGGSHSTAYGINDSGQVVGYSGIGDDSITHAFLWHSGTMTDLGDLPGGRDHSEARDINKRGQVVGFGSTTAGGFNRATLWQDGVITNLGELPSALGHSSTQAYSINDRGQVVGTSMGSAFLWSKADGMVDLNGLLADPTGWRLHTAKAINASGQIAGIGMHNGQERSFLLTPVDVPKTPLQLSKGPQILALLKSTLEAVPAATYVAQSFGPLCAASFVPACVALVIGESAVFAVQAWSLGQIINDPPDPDYAVVFVPQPVSFPLVGIETGLPVEVITLANQTISNRAELFSLLFAWRVTLERYNAAIADNDQTAANLQLIALQEYIHRTSQIAEELEFLLGQLTAALRIAAGPIAFDLGDIEEALLELQSNGFGETQTQFLLDLGMLPDDINEIIRQVSELDLLSVSTDPFFVLEQEALALGNFSQISQCSLNGCFRVNSVPEPGTLLLFGSGLLGLIGRRRKWAA